MAEWDRDLTIDMDAVRRAAGSPAGWRPLGAGWDCDAWIADEALVWRVPRRQLVVPELAREAAVMPLLARHLPTAVPVPTLVESPGLPPLLRHEFIPGRELAETGETQGLGERIGNFLKALHAPEVAVEVARLLPRDPLHRADPAKRIEVATKRLDQIGERIDTGPLRSIVAASHGPPLAVSVVTHGDLHTRHILVDASGALSGVIDWGDCCLGSRAVDLSIATALSATERRAFFLAYGEVDEPTRRHARLLGVMVAASLFVANPDRSVERSSRRWLERLVEDAA